MDYGYYTSASSRAFTAFTYTFNLSFQYPNPIRCEEETPEEFAIWATDINYARLFGPHSSLHAMKVYIALALLEMHRHTHRETPEILAIYEIAETKIRYKSLNGFDR